MPCVPGYRYCGPGCSGPGAPVNQLDAICMEHDALYRQYRSHRIPDEIFLRKVRPLVNHPSKLGKDARMMYRAIKLKSMF